jgi:hypothetical protein
LLDERIDETGPYSAAAFPEHLQYLLQYEKMPEIVINCLIHGNAFADSYTSGSNFLTGRNFRRCVLNFCLYLWKFQKFLINISIDFLKLLWFLKYQKNASWKLFWFLHLRILDSKTKQTSITSFFYKNNIKLLAVFDLC